MTKGESHMIRPRSKVILGLFASLALITSVHAQDYPSRPPKVKNPVDRKAVLALVRAAKATGTDLHNIRLAITECAPGPAYGGNGQFVIGQCNLSAPQWALDGAMAHEMGHAIKRHIELGGLRDLGIVAGLSVLGALLDDKSGVQTGADFGKLVVAFTRPKFTQAQEYEADAVGVEILRREGYKRPGDTMAATLDLFARGAPGGGWLDDHPATPDRIKRVRGR